MSVGLDNGVWRVLKGLMGFHQGAASSTDKFDVDAQVKRAFEDTLSFNMAPSTNAAVNTALRHCYYARSNITVLGASYVPDTAASNHLTNYATIAVLSGSGSAAAATSVASRSTASANMAAGTPWALTLTSAVEVDAGETLAIRILKSGSGLAVPPGALVVHFRYR